MKRPSYRPPQFDPREIRDDEEGKLWTKAVTRLIDEANRDSLSCPFKIGDKVRPVAGAIYRIPGNKKVVKIGERKIYKIEYCYALINKPESVSINGWRVRLVGIKKYWLSIVGLEKIENENPT